MVIFAFLHIRAFGYRTYRPEDRSKTKVYIGLVDSLNPIDTIREISYGVIYLYRFATGKPIPGNRLLDLEMALGKRRLPPTTAPPSYMLRTDSLAHFQRLRDEGALGTSQDPDELMMDNLRGVTTLGADAFGNKSSTRKVEPSSSIPFQNLPREGPVVSSSKQLSSHMHDSSASSAYTSYQYHPQTTAPQTSQPPRIATNPQRVQPSPAVIAGRDQGPQSAPITSSTSTREISWNLAHSHLSMPAEQSMQFGGYDFDGSRDPLPPRRGGHTPQGSQGPPGGQKYNYHVYD